MPRKRMTTQCPETKLSIWNKICKCEVCRKERAKHLRNYRKCNPDKVKDTNLRQAFGISLEEFNKLLKEQNFVCAVCQQPEISSNQYKLMSLAVDHDHFTGKIRGLLCQKCNRALGLLGDNVDTIQALVNYRRRYN